MCITQLQFRNSNLNSIILKFFTFHLLRGSTCTQNSLFLNEKLLVKSPRKPQKAYFNQKFIKNNISYAIFEGEKSESD